MPSTTSSTSRRAFLASAAAPLALAAARPTKDDISLAAWSIVRSFRNGLWKNEDLPRICREEFGVNGLEFVNQFFGNVMQRNLNELKKRGDDYGVKFRLIMIDGEGDMAAADAAERKQAAVSHRKWIDIAHYLGCHAVRCNLGGGRRGWERDSGEIVKRATESFGDLLEYSKDSGLGVVIENHGGASSDPEVLPRIMKAVDDPRFGTLPDFGNLNPGGDPYEVVEKLMPWAKGVSVKAGWTPDGKHPDYDLERLIGICRKAGYSGFWGIESGLHSSVRGSMNGMSADEVWKAESLAVTRTRDVIRGALAL